MSVWLDRLLPWRSRSGDVELRETLLMLLSSESGA
jgi:hypothetical protein